jgi:hypothetical protein
MYSHKFAGRLMRKKVAWILPLFFIYSCDEKTTTIDANYRAEIRQWQMKRVDDLKMVCDQTREKFLYPAA